MLFTADELIEKAKDQRQRSRHEEALISAISATESDPDSAEAWWQVALNRLSLGDAKNALPAIERTLELAPHFSLCWTRYGATLLKTGDEDSAQDAFENALEQDPEQEEALKVLADIYSRQNKDNQQTDERELAILTSLEDVSGLSSNQLNRIGILHYQKKNFFEAIKYWERGVPLSDGPASLFNLGLVYNQPEVSQAVNAVDLWRLTLKCYPNYSKAQEQIDSILPRLLTLAKTAIIKLKMTLLPKDQWYGFYLNPFELLNPPNDLLFEDFDAKTIQRLKKALLQEIELEEGIISWMSGLHVDKSKAIGICEELNDETKRDFHWHVFQNKPLLYFLSCGSHRHFLVNETTSPLETIELLEDQDNGFREWLSEPFAKQFDLVLSKAIDQKNLAVLECLLGGRRWVVPSYADKCFENARRQVDRLLEPLRNARECAGDVMPTVESVTHLLEQVALVDILNLLPTYFRDLQNEAPSIIRDLAISCYNSHSDAELSKNVLQIVRQFAFKTAKLNQSLDDDFKQIEEIIRKQREYIEELDREERKYEVRLTCGSNKWEITKEGIYQGERYFPVNAVVSARWGAIITREGSVKTYDYLFAVKDKKGVEIRFEWKASTDIEKNQKYFSDFLDAAINYLLPSIVEKIDNRLKAGNVIQIGPCSITEQGMQFETKGWVFSDTQFVPWQRVRLEVENGELIVSDAATPKVRTQISLRLIDNAPVLRFLAHLRTPD
jgi:tetratricopeptide (TPR) repeat protein